MKSPNLPSGCVTCCVCQPNVLCCILCGCCDNVDCCNSHFEGFTIMLCVLAAGSPTTAEPFGISVESHLKKSPLQEQSTVSLGPVRSSPFSVQARHDKRRFQSNSHWYIECFVCGGRGCDRTIVNLLLGLYISSRVSLASALFYSRAGRTPFQLLVWGLLPTNSPYSMEHKHYFN